MSNKKIDISQLHKYLNGELDTRAMHQFEQQAQDDPFLMDALDGYEMAGNDQQANINELHERLAKRIAPKKERNIILWRLLPVAACFLMVFGYWYFAAKPNKKQLSNVIIANKSKQPVVQHSLTEQTVAKQHVSVKHGDIIAVKRQSETTQPRHNALIASAVPINSNDTTTYSYKGDVAEYRADDYKVNKNTTVNDLLRRMEGMKVDSNSNIAKKNPDAIAKVTLNGKDYIEGDAAQYVKNLPADIAGKKQVVNDYDNQAVKAKNTLQEKTIGLNVGHADTDVVRGKVVDDKGQPLPGVVVRVKDDPSNATVTDPYGNYKLPLPDNKAQLVYSFVGFDTQEVSAAGKKVVNTTMTTNNSALDEVVVTAYGAQKKSSVRVRVPVKRDTINAKSGTIPLPDAAQGAIAQYITPKKAQPTDGWKKYQVYIDRNAIMPDGTTGNVKLAFTIATDGSVYNVHTLSGRNTAIDQTAINLIKNGPKWIPGTESNEVSLKIKFHKKN